MEPTPHPKVMQNDGKTVPRNGEVRDDDNHNSSAVAIEPLQTHSMASDPSGETTPRVRRLYSTTWPSVSDRGSTPRSSDSELTPQVATFKPFDSSSEWDRHWRDFCEPECSALPDRSHHPCCSQYLTEEYLDNINVNVQVSAHVSLACGTIWSSSSC